MNETAVKIDETVTRNWNFVTRNMAVLYAAMANHPKTATGCLIAAFVLAAFIGTRF